MRLDFSLFLDLLSVLLWFKATQTDLWVELSSFFHHCKLCNDRVMIASLTVVGPI